MEVRHGLPGIRAGVHHNSIARVGVSLFLCNQPGATGKLSEQGLVLKRCVRVIGDVLARHDEYVKRGLRIDIANDDEVVILICKIGGYLPRDDPAKYAILHASVYGSEPFDLCSQCFSHAVAEHLALDKRTRVFGALDGAMRALRRHRYELDVICGCTRVRSYRAGTVCAESAHDGSFCNGARTSKGIVDGGDEIPGWPA